MAVSQSFASALLGPAFTLCLMLGIEPVGKPSFQAQLTLCLSFWKLKSAWRQNPGRGDKKAEGRHLHTFLSWRPSQGDPG